MATKKKNSKRLAEEKARVLPETELMAELGLLAAKWDLRALFLPHEEQARAMAVVLAAAHRLPKIQLTQLAMHVAKVAPPDRLLSPDFFPEVERLESMLEWYRPAMAEELASPGSWEASCDPPLTPLFEGIAEKLQLEMVLMPALRRELNVRRGQLKPGDTTAIARALKRKASSNDPEQILRAVLKACGMSRTKADNLFKRRDAQASREQARRAQRKK